VAAVTLWVRVGYFDETDAQIGLSHVLEHMYFQGSENYRGPERMATEIKELGGQLNAATYYDSTHYYVVLPAENLSKALEIQADALRRPLFEAETLGTEIGAIIQEARRKRDNAAALALEKTYALAFRNHRIRRWRIGEEEQLKTYRREDLLAFLKMFYVPERLVVSVSGAVDPGDVLARVEDLFGGMAAGNGAVVAGPEELPHKGFRHERMHGDINRAHLVTLYRAPERFHPDEFPLRILGVLLGGGRSCRLFQAVREKHRLVNSIGASMEALSDIGLFTVMAETDTATVGPAQRAILDEIARARDGFTEWELSRARAILESRYYAAQSDVLGLSLTLARFEALGGYRLVDEFFEKLFAVDRDSVARVAARYLDPDNATLLEYLPEKGKVPAKIDPRPGEAVGAAGPLAEEKTVDPDGPRNVRFESRPAPAPTDSPVEVHDTDGGLRLLLRPIPSMPVASLYLMIPGGKAAEDADTNGITLLLQSSMLKGSRRWPGAQLAAEIESIGGGLGREIADDFFGFSLRTLSRQFPAALDILFDMLFRPELSSDEIRKERKNQIAAIQSSRDEAMSQAFRLFRRTAFPGSRYALAIPGTLKSVRGLDPDRVREWHAEILRRRGAVLAVAGDFDPDTLRREIERRISEWPGRGKSTGRRPRKTPSKPGRKPPRTLSVRRKRRQTAQIVGFPAPPLGHADQYPLQVLQGFTSGLAGRFFREIRSRRGLAYTVSSMLFQARKAGSFLVYMATSPEREREARKILLQEVEALRRDGPDGDEIRRSIRYLKGSYLVGLQTNSAKAASLAEAEVTGIGYREIEQYPKLIEAVTREQVHEVIRRWLDPGECRLGIVRGEPGE
jgi:zinc protease